MDDATDSLHEPLVATRTSTELGQHARLVIMIAMGLGAGILVTQGLRPRNHLASPGTIEAPRLNLYATGLATVGEVHVQSNELVSPGQPILRLEDAALARKLAEIRRALAITTAEIEQVQAQTSLELAWRRRELQGEAFQTQLKLKELQQQQVSRQVEQLAWKSHLSRFANNDRLASNQSLLETFLTLKPANESQLQALLMEDAALGELESLGGQIQLCEDRMNGLDKLDRALEDQVRLSRGLPVLQVRSETLSQELAELEAQQQRLNVQCSSHGVIGRALRQVGEVVQPGDIVADVIDLARPYVIAQVAPERGSAFPEGGTVTVRFPSGETRRGAITRVDREAGSAGDAHRVRVSPIGRGWPALPVGTGVTIQP